MAKQNVFFKFPWIDGRGLRHCHKMSRMEYSYMHKSPNTIFLFKAE